MLTSKCIWAYRDFFNNNDCAFAEPGNQIMILNSVTGDCYLSPFNETDEIFFDRIERCKREQRNLFFEEWKPINYEKEKIY